MHHRRKLERGAYLHKHRRVPHIEMLPPKYASSAPRPTVGIWQPRALALLEVGVTAERVNLNTAALLAGCLAFPRPQIRPVVSSHA